jgi:two-component system KDP operon response regulator KdpE
MTSGQTILVIDDEQQIRRLLQITLEASGFRLLEAATGEEGLLRLSLDHPDLVILDLGLPDQDGLQVLRKLREGQDTPVVILSVRNHESDIIASLEAGADDYLMKPFRTGELIARVRTALRHRRGEPLDRHLSVADLDVDLEARVVKKKGEVLRLTQKEYSLLILFLKNAGRVLTHRYILEQVWGPAYAEETHYSRIYVAQLRKKLEDLPSNPKLILTESGIGYRLAVP